MGAKKFQNLFIKSGASIKKGAPLKNAETSMQSSSSAEKTKPNTVNNTQDKVVVENLKNAISNKLKDPAMAKKAAQIISDLLNKK